MMKTAFYLFVIEERKKRKNCFSFFIFMEQTKTFGGGLSHQKYKYSDSDEYFTPIETVENIFQKLPACVKKNMFSLRQ